MKPSLQFVQPDGWAPPRGYANGAVTRGALLHVAGQIGWNSQQEFETDDFAEQFAQTLDNVIAVVRSAGGEPTDIASMTGFITSLDEYRTAVPALGPIWKARMGRHFPAMAFIGVAGLVEPRAKIEIQAVAVLRD